MLVDTNIFLEQLLGGRRATECEEFLESVSSGRSEAVVTNQGGRKPTTSVVG